MKQTYGLLIELSSPADLLTAARAARDEGYKRMDAYCPFPLHGLGEALGAPKTRLPWIVLAGGIVGCLTGYLMQYWYSAISYPLIVGGRQFNSWPAFMPVTFEMTILFSAITAVLAMLALNGLPQPYHPLFNVEKFDRATQDGFFLCIQSRDPKFDLEKTTEFLKSLGGDEPTVVPV